MKSGSMPLSNNSHGGVQPLALAEHTGGPSSGGIKQGRGDGAFPPASLTLAPPPVRRIKRQPFLFQLPIGTLQVQFFSFSPLLPSIRDGKIFTPQCNMVKVISLSRKRMKQLSNHISCITGILTYIFT